MTLLALATAEPVLRFGLIEPGWTMMFQLVNTLILFLILRKLLFKPVTEFMEKRDHDIKHSIEAVENKQAEAEAMMTDYKQKIANAKAEGEDIIRQAVAKAEARSADIVRETESHVIHLKESASKDIEQEKNRSIYALKNEIADLALMAAAKVVEVDMDASKHKAMVDKFIDEVGERTWQN